MTKHPTDFTDTSHTVQKERKERHIYIELVSTIKEDMTSKTWYLMMYQDENYIVFSLSCKLSTASR